MSKTIPVRFTEEKWVALSSKAQSEGLGLSTYVKRCIDRGEEVAEQIAGLRREIEAAAHRAGADAAPPEVSLNAAERGLLIETALLLRSVVGPDKLAMVHAELRRQALPVWGPER